MALKHKSADADGQSSTKKYAYIDAIRGIAILGVIAVHTSTPIFGPPAFIKACLEMGQYGVQLFFVASALTLCLSSARRHPKELHPTRNFFIRRFFRIAPMYYMGILIYFLLRGYTEGHFPPDRYTATAIIANLTFIHGWHPETINYVVPGGWSIAVEFTFYAIFPILFTALGNLRRIVIFLLASIILSFVAFHVVSDDLQVEIYSFEYFWFFTQLPVFAIGILLYHLLERLSMWQQFHGNWHLHFILLTISLLLCGVGALSFNHALLFSPVVFGSAFLFLILSLASVANPILVNPITIWIGRWSYSLYLVHFIFAWWLVPWSSRQLGLLVHPLINLSYSLVSVLLLSVLLASMTYRFIELPGMRLGKTLIQRWQR